MKVELAEWAQSRRQRKTTRAARWLTMDGQVHPKCCQCLSPFYRSLLDVELEDALAILEVIEV